MGDGERKTVFISPSPCPTLTPSLLLPYPRARRVLVRGDLTKEYVAHLLARHVEVHQELLAARRDFHAVEERALVRTALGDATEVDHHAVAARQLLCALLRRRVR